MTVWVHTKHVLSWALITGTQTSDLLAVTHLSADKRTPRLAGFGFTARRRTEGTSIYLAAATC